MIENEDLKKIRESLESFFEKLTIKAERVEVRQSKDGESESVICDVIIKEPQILIGEKGQTLSEIQRLMKTVLSKKLQKVFYLNIDINEYKKKKLDFLKDLAKDLADQVAFTGEKKVLLPMASYERRAIHAELAHRSDVATESRGEGEERYIIIKPK